MRVAYTGDVAEAARWLGKARQEIARLQQRMQTQGLEQGSFGHQASPRVYISGKVLPNGIEQVLIDARPEVGVGIVPGGPSYEFYTAEHVTGKNGSPGHLNVGSPPTNYVCGSLTRSQFSGAIAESTPVYSSSLTPTAGAWTARDCEALEGDGDAGVITNRSWQSAKFMEHAWWPDNGSDELVTSTQGRPQGVANMAGRESPYFAWQVGNLHVTDVDIGLDIRPSLYSAEGRITAAPTPDLLNMFWRRAAVQTVDGRRFFISTDNYGRFQIYSATDRAATDNLVPPGEFLTITPPYPGWVTLPDTGDASRALNDWNWRFNKDATKCVAIPFHQEPTPGFYKALTYYIPTFIDSDLPDLSSTLFLMQAKEDTPGLVEFGIEITVTGPGEMDFSVNFTLLRNSYFADHGRYFVEAAYSLPDVETIGVDEDTLITAEIECFCPPGYYQAGPINAGTPAESVDAVYGLQTFFVFNSNDDGLSPTQQFRQIFRDGTSIRFPNRASFDAGGDPALLLLLGQDVPQASGPDKRYTPAGPVRHIDDGAIHTVPATLNADEASAGFIYGMEAATLSLLYEIDDYIAHNADFRAQHYNQTVFTEVTDLSSFFPFLVNDGRPAATERITSSRIHGAMWGVIRNFDIGTGFCVHPEGHWSLCGNGPLNRLVATAALVDIVSVKTEDDKGNPIRVNTTHKELFNTAFGQSRDYTFYDNVTTWTSPDDFFDRGNFRTNAFWVTFRNAP